MKLPFVSLSASWVFGVSMLDLDLGVQLIRSKNLSRATLWVLDTCLIFGLRAFIDHFDHCFIVFKDVQLRLALRIICECGDVIHMRQGFPSVWVWICDSANSFLLLGWLVFWYCSMNVTLLSPHPINQEQRVRLFANQHPTK